MRIGIDVRLWNETGVGRYIRNLVISLVELDKENDYVLFARKKDRETIRKLVSKKWKIVPVDIRWHTITEQFLFASVINSENLDVMHFPYFSLPILYRKPFVVTIHDLIIHHFSTGKASTLPVPIYKVKRLGYEQVLQYAVKKGKRIIVPLQAVKKDLVHAFHVPDAKVTVTPEGFDTSLSLVKDQKPVQLPVKKYFLYVGNAYPHKNLDILLKGFSLYKTKHPEETTGLILAGKDDFFYKKLREQIQKEALQSVYILNDLPDAQLAQVYAQATCLISPSLMEGFGLTALEALALSCIPVVSDIPAFHEVCGEGAIYFNPTSPKSLMEKMEYVQSLDTNSRGSILKAGKERLKKFSWKDMASQTLEIYKSCSATA